MYKFPGSCLLLEPVLGRLRCRACRSVFGEACYIFFFGGVVGLVKGDM